MRCTALQQAYDYVQPLADLAGAMSALSETLYSTGQQMNGLVQDQLQGTL